MKIRREIKPKSTKKRIISSIISLDKNVTDNTNKLATTTSSSIGEGFSTPVMTTTSSTSCANEAKHAPNPPILNVPVIVCFVLMACLLVLAIYFGFHYRRKFNERNGNSTAGDKAIISQSNGDIEVDIQESKRSSASSFLAIEVMTNTLSNIIKQQGGKIEVPSPVDPNMSATNDLVKVKSLEAANEDLNTSKGVNSFKSLANNIFRSSFR
ncbi:hypothetical protein C1645_805479 [Glomus cerebriforme]|uniref:Uncharacterized protein n=1 Tax=Glomus cerebriforme TaxID=658196 RepID=A0A397T3L3_9GLOM|nr:hypothetical protein C1645_805479 [Glomus cerebriforme]